MTVDEILEFVVAKIESAQCRILESTLSAKGRSGWESSLPLSLAAWHHTPNRDKQERLKQHIRWAHDHGALSRVATFL
jgi:hypothetical protein